MTFLECHRAKLTFIHQKDITNLVMEIFDEKPFLTLSKGHRAKLNPPVYCHTPFFYMLLIQLKAVTSKVKEIFDETVFK